MLKSIKAGTYYFADDVFSAIAEVPLPPTDEFLKQLSDEAFVHAPEATVRTLPKGGAARAIASKLHAAQNLGEVGFVPTGFEPLVFYP